MPVVLTHVWPTPPANEKPLSEDGDRHSQAWVRYFQGVSDELATVATLRQRLAALEARIAALEGP